ncbi:MAG: hypothetical protein ACFNUU_01620 [Campylobacter sp.]
MVNTKNTRDVFLPRFARTTSIIYCAAGDVNINTLRIYKENEWKI